MDFIMGKNNGFFLIETFCRMDKDLSYMEKKILYMIDVELSNRNPNFYFHVDCTGDYFGYEYRDKGKNFKKMFDSREEFFQSLSDFQKNLKFHSVGLCRTGTN
jgi:hypothetical protein